MKVYTTAPSLKTKIGRRQRVEDHVDAYLRENPHIKDQFKRVVRHSLRSASVNEIDHYIVESDGEGVQSYLPAPTYKPRIDFEHAPLPSRVMKLTAVDDQPFNCGSAVVVSQDQPDEETLCLIADGNWVLVPGAELSLPTKLAKHGNFEPDLRANCILHKHAFVGSFDEDLPILNTLSNVKNTGFVVTNRTDKTITIPDCTKLAHVEFVKTKTMFGVANINKLMHYEDHGTFEPLHPQRVQTILAAAENAVQTKKWTAKDPDRIQLLLKQMEKSRWSQAIRRDERLFERIEYIDEKLTFDKNSPLTDEQQWDIRILLLCYADRICLDMEDLPMANVAPMRINIKNHPPIKLKMRPTPINARPYLKKHIAEMLRGRVIKPVNDSPYGFPLVIVPKPDGEFRVCIDFREINNVTVVQQGPIPLLQDMINGVRGKVYMASLDLTKAYWQLPMSPEDCEKCTFICEEGTFMFLRVPFGLAGAVTHYQSVLRDMLASIPVSATQHMANYIDDVFIGAETFEEWQQALELFLVKIREVNLKIGLKKSSFGGRSVKYLGFIATKDTWYPDPGRVKDLLDRPPPDDLKKLRGFCSAVAFYKRFLPDNATLLEPLYQRLRGLEAKHAKKSRKPISIPLDPDVVSAWEECKALLQAKIILWHIDPHKEFHLFVDASDTASGSAIMQYQGNDLRPVAFHSKVFNSAERNYCATDRELLGVLQALDKHYYLIVNGPLVHIYTDHKALLGLVVAQTPTKPRLARWRVRLKTYNLKWHYIPGRDHTLADFMSRPPDSVYEKMRHYIENPSLEEAYEYDSRFPRAAISKLVAYMFKLKVGSDLNPEMIDDLIFSCALEIYDNELMAEQRSDRECLEIARYLNTKDQKDKTWEELASSPLAIYARKCVLHKGLLLAYAEGAEATLVPVIPACRRQEVLDAAHADRMGHLRDPRMRQLIESRCSWPTVKVDIKRYLENCSVCTRFLAGRSVKPPPATFIADRFLEQVTMDVFHLGSSRTGHTKALAIIDTWSRFGWVRPLKSESAADQIQALEDSVLQLGIPSKMITDRATAYLSEEFTSWTKNHGIELYPGPGYASNHVAVVNRFHRTLREMFAKTAEQVQDWVEATPYVLRAYNATIHPATGFPPASMVMGSKSLLNIDLSIGVSLRPSDFDRKDQLAHWAAARQLAAEIVTERRDKLQEKALKAYDKSTGKVTPRHVVEGDRVLRTCASDMHKGGKQTAVRYFGPYIVTHVHTDGVHAEIVREIDPEAKTERIHISKLVPLKDRVIIPIFPSEDIIKRENQVVIRADTSIRPNPTHKHGTRSQRF